MDSAYINNNPLVVAIDIGTTKICAVAGRRNFFGKLEILAVGKVESEGVLRGVVSNIEKTVRSISDAVRIVDKNLRKLSKWFTWDRRTAHQKFTTQRQPAERQR